MWRKFGLKFNVYIPDRSISFPNREAVAVMGCMSGEAAVLVTTTRVIITVTNHCIDWIIIENNKLDACLVHTIKQIYLLSNVMAYDTLCLPAAGKNNH